MNFVFYFRFRSKELNIQVEPKKWFNVTCRAETRNTREQNPRISESVYQYFQDSEFYYQSEKVDCVARASGLVKLLNKYFSYCSPKLIFLSGMCSQKSALSYRQSQNLTLLLVL